MKFKRKLNLLNLNAKIYQLIFLIVFFLFVSEVNAKCNFLTGSHIDEMLDPSKISLIKIDIPKNNKYALNLYKIITSKSQNIPPKLKKKFKANVTVYYTFGVCKYHGEVKQNGDWKDHVSLKNGEPFGSLHVKLKDGNILNAIDFKILIPETRNGNNEILATLILRELGFIAPETFEVKTLVNGVESVMLFQEKANKELLERNLRREGPIFKGDESILWANEDFDFKSRLEPLALSRLVNDNWLKKGNNNQKIVIKASSRLQEAYLEYAKNNLKQNFSISIFPNNKDDILFNNFHSIMIAMNGAHSLRPHNRKYYFNVFTSLFEPIYFDGNVNFTEKIKYYDNQKLIIPYSEPQEVNRLLPYGPSKDLIIRSLALGNNDNLLEDYLKRVLRDRQEKFYFYKNLESFKTNIKLLQKQGKNNQSNNIVNKIANFKDKNWYEEYQQLKKLKQKIISEITINENQSYFKDSSHNLFEVSDKDIINLLSKNQINGDRAVYIPSKKYIVNNNLSQINLFDGIVKMSSGLKYDLDNDARIIKFTQTTPTDWVLISHGDLSGWNIFLEGQTLSNKNITNQRMNDFGLTGCLTIYKSVLNNASFKVSDGDCEDSINIVSSVGDGISIFVKDAIADSVDLDFSSLTLKKLEISNAGNDCLDVSGGDYNLIHASLKGCHDKAISVGEKSYLKAEEVFIKHTNIGISSKDFSKVDVSFLDIASSDICIEVKQKKQEFGGAKFDVLKLNCLSSSEIDNNSVLFVGHQ